jgi:hypothetical protein
MFLGFPYRDSSSSRTGAPATLNRLQVGDQFCDAILDSKLTSVALAVKPLAPYRHLARTVSLDFETAVNGASDLIFFQRAE